MVLWPLANNAFNWRNGSPCLYGNDSSFEIFIITSSGLILNVFTTFSICDRLGTLSDLFPFHIILCLFLVLKHCISFPFVTTTKGTFISFDLAYKIAWSLSFFVKFFPSLLASIKKNGVFLPNVTNISTYPFVYLSVVDTAVSKSKSCSILYPLLFMYGKIFFITVSVSVLMLPIFLILLCFTIKLIPY